MDTKRTIDRRIITCHTVSIAPTARRLVHPAHQQRLGQEVEKRDYVDADEEVRHDFEHVRAVEGVVLVVGQVGRAVRFAREVPFVHGLKHPSAVCRR